MARRKRKSPPPPPDEFHALHKRSLTTAQEERLRALMGKRVKAVRLELGLTQELLGRAYGRSQPWAREVEAGRQWPPHWLLAGLARATEHSVGWFYGEDA